MNQNRVERIEAKVKPSGLCYRADWGDGRPSKCPFDHELEPTEEDCDRCTRASE